MSSNGGGPGGGEGKGDEREFNEDKLDGMRAGAATLGRTLHGYSTRCPESCLVRVSGAERVHRCSVPCLARAGLKKGAKGGMVD